MHRGLETRIYNDIVYLMVRAVEDPWLEGQFLQAARANDQYDQEQQPNFFRKRLRTSPDCDALEHYQTVYRRNGGVTAKRAVVPATVAGRQ